LLAPLTVMNGRRNKANQDVRLRHDCQEETPGGGPEDSWTHAGTQPHWKSSRDNDLAKLKWSAEHLSILRPLVRHVHRMEKNGSGGGHGNTRGKMEKDRCLKRVPTSHCQGLLR
jgi:hypothetical protein